MSFILISKLRSLSSPQNGMSFHGQLYMYIRMLRLRASFYPKHSCYAFVQSVSEASLYTNAGIFYPPGTVHTVMFYVILNVHKTRSEYCIYCSCSLTKQCVTFLQLLPQSVLLLCLLHYILQSVSGGDIVGDRNGWFRTEYAAGTYHPRHIPEVYMCRCTA